MSSLVDPGMRPGSALLPTIRVNGETQSFAPPWSVAQLLEARGLAGRRLAVERNGMIVPRTRHDRQLLADGDRIEIVMAVGGG